ncbi:hypothetical protein O3689_12225 [Prevotella nigrescens]|uniref:hypothetical protein n=1 Tax=Prevotella nigrescens TaxID=28133 RepID=UPI00241FE156|nr:hypothetical protein [Prevotella nigrescens]
MVKAAVLRCKIAAFAILKRSYHFLTELSLQDECNVSSALPIALPLPKGIYIVQIKDANGKTYTNKITN